MKQCGLLILMIVIAVTCWCQKNNDAAFINENKLFVDLQLHKLLEAADKQPGLFPRTIDSSGKMIGASMYDWTSGFFPGMLWFDYINTKKSDIRKAAATWTLKLESLKSYTETHDLGFMMYCSFGNAYKLTGDTAYKNILIQSARSLATRFNPLTGTIRSWNRFGSWHGDKIYNFPVIIDNMMNLELLFFAAKVTGDTSLRRIAITHAEKTMQNQLRPDYSCYHVVCYDSANGQVLAKETAQGYADNSTWSRGQAWGIYGFTLTYRETKDPRFLETAKRMADFFLDNKNLPADKVPYWDFNAGEPGYTPAIHSHANETTGKPRDASAAAIVSSALFELSSYCEGDSRKKYLAAAIQILHSLAGKNYRALPGTNGDFLLLHCVGHLPNKGEIDKPLIYADYYFMEALQRYGLVGSQESGVRSRELGR